METWKIIAVLVGVAVFLYDTLFFRKFFRRVFHPEGLPRIQSPRDRQVERAQEIKQFLGYVARKGGSGIEIVEQLNHSVCVIGGIRPSKSKSNPPDDPFQYRGVVFFRVFVSLVPHLGDKDIEIRYSLDAHGDKYYSATWDMSYALSLCCELVDAVQSEQLLVKK